MRAKSFEVWMVPAAALCFAILLPPGGTLHAEDKRVSLAYPARGGDGELTLFLGGDAIITQPWSKDQDPAFLALVDAIRAADVALVNLELVLHTFKGCAQADSGGGHMAARPAMAGELAWAGIDMVAHANNHTFDYGSIGVLETLDSVARAGLVLAGAGKDLQDARAPAYLPHPDGTVGLVATASTFVPYGKASRSIPDLHGRPGLNPLTATRLRYLELPRFLAGAVPGIADLFGLPYRQLDDEWGRLRGLHIRAGPGFGLKRSYRVDPKDAAANLTAVREAAARAELTVFSIHAHRQGAWLTELAHRAIDAGADLVFAHGPHRMLGIELRGGKPIFYGLGDFVFQPHRVERFPAEHYDRTGLGEGATVEDVRRAFVARSPLYDEAEPWESVAALLRFRGGALSEIRLLPLDLRFTPPASGQDKARLADDLLLGKPRLAAAAMGRRVIGTVGERSRAHGTRIRYVEGENAGLVELASRP